MNETNWKILVSKQKGISKDKILRAKLWLKVSAPYGHAFKDLEHYNLVDLRLEDKLNRLAKRHNYKGNEFYVSYQAWTDKN